MNKQNSPGGDAVRSRGRIHHSPLFWVGALLFLAAISIYLWSEDLSRLPWS